MKIVADLYASGSLKKGLRPARKRPVASSIRIGWFDFPVFRSKRKVIISGRHFDGDADKEENVYGGADRSGVAGSGGRLSCDRGFPEDRSIRVVLRLKRMVCTR